MDVNDDDDDEERAEVIDDCALSLESLFLQNIAERKGFSTVRHSLPLECFRVSVIHSRTFNPIIRRTGGKIFSI